MGAGESIQWWGTHSIDRDLKKCSSTKFNRGGEGGGSDVGGGQGFNGKVWEVLLGFLMLIDMGNLSPWAAEFARNSPGEGFKAAVFSEGAAVVNKGNFDKVYFFVCFS